MVPTQPSSMPGPPDVSEGEIEQPDEKDKIEYDAESAGLAIFRLGIACPGEEGHDVARLLIDGRLGSIGVGNAIIGQGRWHRDLMTGIIGIVMHARCNSLAGRWRPAEARDEPIDIVAAPGARAYDQGQVRWQPAVHGHRLPVQNGWWKAVGGRGRPHRLRA